MAREEEARQKKEAKEKADKEKMELKKKKITEELALKLAGIELKKKQDMMMTTAPRWSAVVALVVDCL